MRVLAPEAVHTAVVAGDPCYDRIRASVAFRTHYRRLFGADAGHRVVVVTTTWGRRSLLGSRPNVLRDLLTESPVDTTRIIAVVHPNTWHGHGPWQVRTWLADCVRAGLVIVPALEGWRAALIAADCVIGDHGAVTCYGASIDRPVLLGSFPEADVAAGSPVDILGRLAPHLDFRRSLTEQVDRAITGHRPGWFAPVADMVSSFPDEAPQRVRRVCYDRMGLDEPDTEPVLARVPNTGISAASSPSATIVTSQTDMTARTVRLVRHPAELTTTVPKNGSAHLAVSLHHPGPLLRAQADVVHASDNDLATHVDDTLATILATHPGAAVAAVAGPGRCTVQIRDGARLVLSGADLTSEAWASAVFAWIASGNDPHSLDGVQLFLGRQHTNLSVAG